MMEGLIMYAMGSLALIVGIKLWKDANRVAANEEKVVGIIIDVVRKKNWRERLPTYELEVYFTTRDGQKISKKLEVSTSEKRKEGEKVNLVYDATDPYNVMEDSFGRRVLAPRILTAIGLLLLVLGSLQYLDIIDMPFNQKKNTEIHF